MQAKIKQLFPSKTIFHRLIDLGQEFASRVNCADSICISFETSVQCRKFCHFNLSELCFCIKQTKESDRSLYEVIPTSKPVKLYIDFEYCLSLNHDIDDHTTGLKFVLKILHFIFTTDEDSHVSNEQMIAQALEQYLVLTASTAEKVSYHIIHAYPSIIFENNQTLGLFIRSTIHCLLELVIQHKCPYFSMDLQCKSYSIHQLISLLGPHICSMRIRCVNCLIYGKWIYASDIAYLLILNKKHEWTLAVDTHVYSKNQQFRLFNCVKIGQNNAFTQTNDFPFQVGRDHSFDDILHASLITNIQQPNKPLVQFNHNDIIFDINIKMFCLINLQRFMSKLNDRNDHLKINPTIQHIHPVRIDQSVEISGLESPTSIDFYTDFVRKLIKSDSNQEGFIRSQVIGTRNPNILMYNIGGNYRFCPRKGSHHHRNNVCILIDKINCKFTIRCKDPQCDNSILIWNKIT